MNRLGREKSPYLQQHADNPVDWFPWGDEAFQRAREADKPVLVSIGYSSCHWCHVMAHESFEDERTADRMNELLVSIKVDREERPDVDAIFMEAVQRLGVPGGWPLNVFLTPKGEPFWGGTYFPPTPRGGMPSWVQVVEAIVEQYQQNRDHVDRVAGELTDLLRSQHAVSGSGCELDASILSAAVRAAAPSFNWRQGGFGGAPKFPQPNALEFLLRSGNRVPEAQSERFVGLTLHAMADGGIYDHLGGGFHRYTVDADWTVPHFEKMLYDNALLARLYTDAWRDTGEPGYRRVTEGTLGYVLDELLAPEGGLYSSQDADSEGVEGKYYVWTPGEIEAVLPKDEATAVRLHYGVSDEGNFEGRSILRVTVPASRVAELMGCSEDQVEELVDAGRRTLLQERRKRVPPATDRKILASWNALAIRALVEAGAAFERPDLVDAGCKAADFILESMRRDGRLMRSYQDGLSDVPGFLEDYAFLVEALLSVYECTGEVLYFGYAQSLADDMIDLFGDGDSKTFFDTGSDAAELLIRPRSFFDNPIPSGAASASMGLLRLNAFAPDSRYEEWGTGPMRWLGGALSSQPLHVSYVLCSLDLYVSGATQVAIVAGGDETAGRDLARTVWRTYLPNRALAAVFGEGMDSGVELLEGRTALDGRATAYVCRNFACQLPVHDPGNLVKQLEESRIQSMS